MAVLIVIVACILAFVTHHWIRYWRVRGPTLWPILGSTLEAWANHDRFYDWITDLLLRFDMTYSAVVPWVPSMNAIMTCSPENVEHITKSSFKDYPKGPPVLASCQELLGHGIFNSDDEQWNMQRRVAAVEFESPAMTESVAHSVTEGVKSRLMPVLHHFASRGQTFDLQDVLLRYTFDNVCMVTCGVDPRSLTTELAEVPFAAAMNHLTEVSTSRFLVPPLLWKAKRLLRLGQESEVTSATRIVNDFAAGVIQSRKLLQTSGSASSKHTDLLSRFMLLRDSNGKPYSDAFLRDVIINFILAGRDTSAVALSWFFWLVNTHPETEQKILQEIAEILRSRNADDKFSSVEQEPFPNSCTDEIEQTADDKREEAFPTADASVEAESDYSDAFTPEELKRMHFLHAALSESLRLFPPVPVDMKYAANTDILPDGTHVPAGYRVYYSLYSMARMPQIWGPDCREFKPERWLRKGAFRSQNPYKFAVFNAGPRLCLGKRMAYLQMKSLAATILRHYHVRVQPNHTVKYRLSLTLFIKDGLMVNLQKRKRVPQSETSLVSRPNDKK